MNPFAESVVGDAALAWLAKQATPMLHRPDVPLGIHSTP